MSQHKDDQFEEKVNQKSFREEEELAYPIHADDPTFKEQVQKLYQLNIYARWLVVASLWMTIGILSLWGLRYPISLMLENFTWAALRYGLAFHQLPTLGIGLCVGSTTAVLLWQSRNILWGIPEQELRRLEQQVLRVRHQGASHPLWKWIC